MPRTTAILIRSQRRTKILTDLQHTAIVNGPTDPYPLEAACDYCLKRFDNAVDCSRHVALNPDCREVHEVVNQLRRAQLARERERRRLEEEAAGDEEADQVNELDAEEPWDYGEGTSAQGAQGTWATANHTPAAPATPEPEPEERCADGTILQHFPVAGAGAPIVDAQAQDLDPDVYLKACGNLADPDYFEIAELLMTTGLSNTNRTRFLKSKLYKGKTPWKNCKQMLDDIDVLPGGPKFKVEPVPIDCDGNEHMNYLVARNVIEVVRELIGNRRFKKIMRYAPVRKWRLDARGNRSRVYGEMWTAEWWWKMQYVLSAIDKQATIAPLIVASDKTSLSIMSGGQQAYPVYLTIGNIPKSTRRKAKKNATVLLGYLPVDKFEDAKNPEERARLRAELVHRSMEKLMAPLKTASEEGVVAWCADGRMRRVYPIMAAFVGDWPEQTMMASTGESGCPICEVKRKGRGDLQQRAPARKPSETLAALRSYEEYDKHKGELEELDIKPWWPWWADLPYCNFHASIAPDLLHQLHQGIFKSHLLPWTYAGMKEAPANRRFMAMSSAEGMRHFKKKVSKIKQWTGRESKELMKQFLPVVVGSGCDPDFVAMVRAALDFMYYAHSAELTTEDLEEMDRALEEFHRLKSVVVRMGIFQNMGRFDKIAKLHMMSHYTDLTRELGAPDGYNTESPEHLHIMYAKTPYRASNKCEPTQQMVNFIERQEKLRMHKAHLAFCLEGDRGEDEEDEEAPDGKDVVMVEEDEDFREEEEEEEEEEDEGDEGNEGDEDEDEDEAQARGDRGQGRDWVGEPGNRAEDGHQHEERELDVHYPSPVVSIAKVPTRPGVRLRELVGPYGAEDLIWALGDLLIDKLHVAADRAVLSLDHVVQVWHRFSLRHLALPFAPHEPRKRDVVRARCAQAKRAAAFDTVLFVHAPEKDGLDRYRAGRVRAIFALPSHLQHISSRRFVYLELFSPFRAAISPFHRMRATSHSIRTNQKRITTVIPLSDVVMACHLAPNFKNVPLTSDAPPSIDPLSAFSRFHYNPYYNYYVHKLSEHWRRAKAQPSTPVRTVRSRRGCWRNTPLASMYSNYGAVRTNAGSLPEHYE
ncbi:hypothetical protein FRC09_002431, partial [Ceratobasidium sp. 395]